MIKKILLLEKFNLNSKLNELDYYFKNMTINQKGKRIEFVDSKKEIIFYYYDYNVIDLEANKSLNDKDISKYIYNLYINLSYSSILNYFIHLKNIYDINKLNLEILIREWFATRKKIEIVYFELININPPSTRLNPSLYPTTQKTTTSPNNNLIIL